MNEFSVTDLMNEMQMLSVEMQYIASLIEAAQREIKILVEKVGVK